MMTISFFYKSVFSCLILKYFLVSLSFHLPVCFPSWSVCFHLWVLPLLFNYNMSITKGAASLCNILEFLIQLWETMGNSIESSCMPESIKIPLYRSGWFQFYFGSFKSILLRCKIKFHFSFSTYITNWMF